MKVMHASSRGDAASVPIIVMTVNAFADDGKKTHNTAIHRNRGGNRS